MPRSLLEGLVRADPCESLALNQEVGVERNLLPTPGEGRETSTTRVNGRFLSELNRNDTDLQLGLRGLWRVLGGGRLLRLILSLCFCLSGFSDGTRELLAGLRCLVSF